VTGFCPPGVFMTVPVDNAAPAENLICAGGAVVRVGPTLHAKAVGEALV
jgi:hypothetical protein